MSDIILNKAVVHIVDKGVGDQPVLSQRELILDEEVEKFVTGHFKKLFSDSDTKRTRFLHDMAKSLELTKAYENGEQDFITVSAGFAQRLHQWNMQAEDSLSGDFLFADFVYNGQAYIGGLKLDYNSSFIHNITYPEDILHCGILEQKTVMPNVGQSIKDGFAIALKEYKIIVKEKKYHIEEEKKSFLSEYVLEARTCMSDKEMLKIVTDTSKKILKENYDDPVRMGGAKEVITQAVVEEQCLDMQNISEKIFEDETSRQAFRTRVRERGIQQDVVRVSESSLRKENLMQRYVTSEGIEISIPVEQMGRKDKVEFLINMDGTVSIVLKNVEVVKEK